MTTAREPQRLDFHDPRRLSPPLLHLLTRWQRELCELTVEAWASVMSIPVGVRVGSIAPVRYRDGMNAAPDPGVGFVINLGKERLQTLMALSPRLVLGVLSDMLGGSDEGWPEERSLTPVEESLIDLLFQKLMRAAADSWPGEAPLPCSIRENCRPRRCRRLASDRELIAVRWTVECRAGSEDCLWLMPRKDIESLVNPDELAELTADGPLEHELEPLAMRIPVELKVELGRTSLTMSEAAGLQVGDVLILDQTLNRPLLCRVAEEAQWLGLPCRLGSRQAFEIKKLLDR